MREGSTVGGRYTVLKKLGEGGMGAVYAARHDGTGRRVAVKVIAPSGALNPQLVARLSVEARALGRVDSDHVAQVLDVGTDDETHTPYLVMELLEGEDLASAIERVGPMDPEAVVKIGAQIAMGLERAHACEIIHRDLKPANLFLAERDGGELRVKILDFGIAKVLGDGPEDGAPTKLTRAGTVMGSPLYMSPDHVYGALTPRSDLWSLGVVLYELLTGRTPFDDSISAPQLLMTICSTQAPAVTRLAGWVPAPLSAIIERALRIDPSARWPDAASMRRALAELAPQGTAITEADLRGPRGEDAVPHTSPARPRDRSAASTKHLQAVTVEASPASFAFQTPSKGATTAPVETSRMPTPGEPTPAARAAQPSGAIGGRALWAGAVALALGGAAFYAQRSAESTSDESAGVIPLPTSSVRPALTSQGSAPTAASATAAPMLSPELLGAWKSVTHGRSYDAAAAGETVEFRIRDSTQLPDQGYRDGEPRFVLSKAADGRYAVLDRVRPLTPAGHVYPDATAPAGCLLTVSEVAGRPLGARLEGDDLIVEMASVTPSPASFALSGKVVTSCVGLGKSQIGKTEVRYRRDQRPP